LGCDIWQVDVVADEFENPIKLNLKSSDSISVGHPCISEDGSMLIFASDMVMKSKGVKSYGGKDLWYVLFDKKTTRFNDQKKKLVEMKKKNIKELPGIGVSILAIFLYYNII
jgi:Tol biopolymer transport system component